MWNCLEVNDLHIGTLTFNAFGFIFEKVEHYRSRAIKNKMACFNDAYPRRLAHEVIWWRSENSCLPENSKIFVSSKVRTARDLFRHSGYQITRNPDNAAATIIPVLPNKNPWFRFDVATYYAEGKVLTLYSVNRNEELRKSDVPYTSDDWMQVQQHFRNRNLTFYQEDFFSDAICEFLPSVEEYRDILTDRHAGYSYLTEESIDVQYPMEISVETLRIWSHYRDCEMLARQICTSNWVEYPTTLVTFLKQERETVNMNRYGGANFKMILDKIGYDYWESVDRILEDRIIQPKDWNMLQSYLMSKMGLTDQGGFVSQESYNDTAKMARFFRKRMAVKPVMIGQPALYQNLIQMADVS